MQALLAKAFEKIHAQFSQHVYQIHVYSTNELRYINVHAKTLQENRETGKKEPMTTVRSASNPHEEKRFHHVEILGPSAISYTPDNPLPNTDGRAICYVHTEAPLLCVLVEYGHK